MAFWCPWIWCFVGYGPDPILENLDRPISNFDIAGVPRGQWHDGLCSCCNNVLPSCIVSFACPCIMFSQVVVRAQIPLFISLKNSFKCWRPYSGYGPFTDFFFWSLATAIALILVLVFAKRIPPQVIALFQFMIAVLLLMFVYAMAHLRHTFKLKYSLPPTFFTTEWLDFLCCDMPISILCLPLSLAQMARHVFQYSRWEPEIGLFLGDPFKLPPLEATVEGDRPAIADEAGLTSSSRSQVYNPYPNQLPYRGGHHTTPVVMVQPQPQLQPANNSATGGYSYYGNNNNNNNNNNSHNDNQPHAVATTQAYVSNQNQYKTYNTDGTEVKV